MMLDGILVEVVNYVNWLAWAPSFFICSVGLT